MKLFKNRKKKKFYRQLLDKVDRGKWDMELRILTLKEIREGVRRQFDRTNEQIKAYEDAIVAERKNKIWDKNKIKGYTELKEQLQGDAQKMQEQMMGKWSEREGKRVGGIDQQIEEVESKIEGGETFREFVKKQMKKL